jgi:two-component system sensor histidine kinase VicK
LNEQTVANVEFRITGHDADIKNVSCDGYLLENGKYVVAIFKDITGMREHENYIINYGAKKNTLLDMVTHNLSGPLAISKNMIESLGNAIKGNDLKNVNAHLKLIEENTRHCIEIVTDFLEEEHLVSEHIYTKKNRFEVITKISTVLERFRKSYPDYHFNIQKNNNEFYISNDDVKFLQVLNNLISNAIKWSPSGSTIEIIIDDSGDTFNLTVSDHGIGIPDKLQDQVFKKYTPASRLGLKGEKSIGMGLYIVKKLVGLMDGAISFKSKENEGSSFTLSLPKEELDENRQLKVVQQKSNGRH